MASSWFSCLRARKKYVISTAVLTKWKLVLLILYSNTCPYMFRQKLAIFMRIICTSRNIQKPLHCWLYLSIIYFTSSWLSILGMSAKLFHTFMSQRKTLRQKGAMQQVPHWRPINIWRYRKKFGRNGVFVPGIRAPMICEKLSRPKLCFTITSNIRASVPCKMCRCRTWGWGRLVELFMVKF